MARESFYTAVDVGTNKVSSVVARVGAEGELKILGTGVVPSQGVQKGRIENMGEVQAAIRSSLEEAQRYIGRGVITGVYVGVSGTRPGRWRPIFHRRFTRFLPQTPRTMLLMCS